MNLKENILTLCKAKNITVKDLELQSGLKLGTVGRWDTSTPSIDKVMKVARFFGVSIDSLVGYEIEKSDSVVLSDDVRDVISRLRSASPEKLAEVRRYLRFLESEEQRGDA